MTGLPAPPAPASIQAAPASVQAAALRAAFPGYSVNVLRQRGELPRFEVVSKDGGSPYCMISADVREIWAALRCA